MVFRVLVYPSHMHLDQRLGLEANAAVKTTLGMKKNCFANVKLYFKNIRVRVRV